MTDEVAGNGCNIVDEPIKLRIYSYDCPDLTMIDLPGITRIDVKGQKDVERVTTEMAARYCKDPKTIILCVIPANQDMAISDGLKLAREWDRNQ
jgi:dynamin 1-like protein